MKILMVSLTFPPFKDGVSEACASAVEAFVSRGWSVDVLTSPCGERNGVEGWKGAKLIEYGEVRSGVLSISGLQCDTVDFFAAGSWDVVIFQAYDPMLYRLLDQAREFDFKTILVSHGFPGLVRYPSKRFPWGYPTMFRHLLRGIRMLFWIRRIDRVVYLSEHADLRGFYDHWLAKIARHPGRCVIPNGVESSLRPTDGDGFRTRHGIESAELLFVCVANYSPRKDQAFAARAFRKAAIPRSRLVFIGSKLNEHAERFIEADHATTPEEERSLILWLEKLERDETLNAFAAADVFVLSALHEAQPISLLEAMREGCPWIARRSGCIHEMEGGICVNSVASMAVAMRELADNASERKRLGDKGVDAVTTRYSLRAYREAYVRMVEELAEPA
jgi:glycosyltransferase involved in cell wall biosynthesis